MGHGSGLCGLSISLCDPLHSQVPAPAQAANGGLKRLRKASEASAGPGSNAKKARADAAVAAELMDDDEDGHGVTDGPHTAAAANGAAAATASAASPVSSGGMHACHTDGQCEELQKCRPSRPTVPPEMPGWFVCRAPAPCLLPLLRSELVISCNRLFTCLLQAKPASKAGASPGKVRTCFPSQAVLHGAG